MPTKPPGGGVTTSARKDVIEPPSSGLVIVRERGPTDAVGATVTCAVRLVALWRAREVTVTPSPRSTSAGPIPEWNPVPVIESARDELVDADLGLTTPTVGAI